MQLEGKAAIVTGGARGIGKGVAAAFVKAGARVLIVDREEALKTARAIGSVSYTHLTLPTT